MSIIKIFIGFFLAGNILFYVSDSIANDSFNIDVTIISNTQEDENYLNFVLDNNSSKSVYLFNKDLPWIALPTKLLIIAVPAGAPNSVLEHYSQLYSTTGKKEILPGDSIQGKLSLNDRFPMLRETLQKQNVYLFWHYEFMLYGQGEPELINQGGWFEINKSGVPSD